LLQVLLALSRIGVIQIVRLRLPVTVFYLLCVGIVVHRVNLPQAHTTRHSQWT
jgi:Kef-type K+ transport system membrane component KefB